MENFTTRVVPYTNSHTEDAYACFQKIKGFLEGIASTNKYAEELIINEVDHVHWALCNFRALNSRLNQERENQTPLSNEIKEEEK